GQHTWRRSRSSGGSRMSKMIRTAGFLAVGLIAGFAVATLLQPDDAEMGFDAVPLPLAARLEDLERRLDWESDARLALMDEIDALRAELDAVATAASADEPGTRLEELARA